MANTIFAHSTVYVVSFVGREFFHTFIDGVQTSLDTVAANNMIASGAALVVLT